MPTADIIAQANTLPKLMVPEALIGDDSPAMEHARKAAWLMIEGAMYADLNRARIAAAKNECETNGEAFLYGGAPYSLLQSNDLCSDPSRKAPVSYTEQTDWRDYVGWLCNDERTAKWVAAWIAKYLDPRDCDGNPAVGVIRQIGDKWLAVRASYKIGD